MKPKTTIDLSKAKIGQKVKTRSGQVGVLEEVENREQFPFVVRWDLDNSITTHDKKGRWWSSTESDGDIIEILPLPKKRKTATHMGQKVDIAENRRQPAQLAKIRRVIADLKAGRDVFSKEIKRLEALL